MYSDKVREDFALLREELSRANSEFEMGIDKLAKRFYERTGCLCRRLEGKLKKIYQGGRDSRSMLRVLIPNNYKPARYSTTNTPLNLTNMAAGRGA